MLWAPPLLYKGFPPRVVLHGDAYRAELCYPSSTSSNYSNSFIHSFPLRIPDSPINHHQLPQKPVSFASAIIPSPPRPLSRGLIFFGIFKGINTSTLQRHKREALRAWKPEAFSVALPEPPPPENSPPKTLAL